MREVIRSSAAPRASLLRLIAGLALALVPSARAEEVVVQNDSVDAGDLVAIQVGFIAGESAAAWLTSPCDGTIVAVQVFWQSFFGNAAPSLEDSITIYESGAFPSPGAVLEILEGPLMIDGKINEFRFVDKNQQIPLSVPVSKGEVVVVSFTFADTPPPLGPSVVTDIDGCQTPKNALFAIPPGWINPCPLGIAGDFFIRAVVDCGAGLGACCLPDGDCLNDESPGDCEAMSGVFQGNGSDCGDVECPAPEGACCFPNDFCLVLEQADCVKAGATWLGPELDCADDDENGTADACEDCPEDLDDDGLVGFDDLLAILAAWGPCPDCPEDLNGNDAVDFDDLLRILDAWGPCE